MPSKAQRVDEKNWVVFLVIMFNPEALVIKMSKMAYLLYFFADNSKTLFIVWENYLGASERSYFILLRNAMDY